MIRPDNAIKYEEVDLKLGIKSSLPNVKATLALLMMIWKVMDCPSEVQYSQSNDNMIVIADEIKEKLIRKYSSFYNTIGITDEQFIEKANSNQMLKSQLESLIVAFELIWRVAKVKFSNNMPASTERTGQKRYPKTLFYTTNMDIINLLISSDDDNYSKILLSWIGLEIEIDTASEKALQQLLMCLSEKAIYKLDDNGKDIIFNMNSVYLRLLSGEETVDINGDKEAKGSLRILKSALSDDLNYLINYSSGNVSISDESEDTLRKYQQRVNTFLSLSGAGFMTIQENGQAENADVTDVQAINYKTNYDSPFSRNRILFGAPGTGKSYTLNKEKNELLSNGGEFERVTFHPDYSYANFVGTYKPTMLDPVNDFNVSGDEKDVLSILLDKSTTAQDKYDLLYDKFKEEGLTRLPILLGLYTDESFKTLKKDGTDAAGDNSVERNHGRAIRPYVNLITEKKSAPEIAYEYVPGPFMRTLVKALRNSKTDNPKPILLIIEEINRANMAAVFGDVFQLLDRDDDEVSEYPIQASEDMKKYLAKELDCTPEDFSEIRIPDNMFIWATMNSADQGVFPMDTAFKRRWDFTYLGINDSESAILGKTVVLGVGSNKRTVEWNALRRAINEELSTYKVNEDKLLGPYFISKKVLGEGTVIDSEKFASTFKSKVIMYLFDDAAKQKRQTLFGGCADTTKYSAICSEFDSKGVFIFGKNISDKFPAPALTANTAEDGAE